MEHKKSQQTYHDVDFDDDDFDDDDFEDATYVGIHTVPSAVPLSIPLGWIRALCSTDAAAMLAYLLYCGRGKRPTDPVKVSVRTLRSDLNLSRRKQDAAEKMLVYWGVVSRERHGYPLETYYWIHHENIEKVMQRAVDFD